MQHLSGASSLACCESVGPIKLRHSATAFGFSSTIANTGPLLPQTLSESFLSFFLSVFLVTPQFTEGKQTESKVPCHEVNETWEESSIGMFGIESNCSWFIQMHPFLGDDCKASSLNLLFDCITVVGSNSIGFHHCKCPLNPFRLCTSIQGVDRFLNLNYLPLIFILCTTLLLPFSHNFTKNVQINQNPSKIWDKKEDATSDPQVGMQKLCMQRWSKFNPILRV